MFSIMIFKHCALKKTANIMLIDLLLKTNTMFPCFNGFFILCMETVSNE